MPQQLTFTVGPDTADLPGFTHLAIQAAVDHVAASGGGTVRLLPGRYDLRGAVRLRGGIRLEGCGPDTHLVKCPEFRSDLADDADWYQTHVDLVDASGFRVGDTIVLEGEPPHGGSPGLHREKRIVVAVEGNRLHLNDWTRKNYWALTHEATCSLLFPLIWIEGVAGVEVARLRLDGNREQNGLLDGNHAGCVFMQYAQQVLVEEIIACHNHGDGISWQVADDVTVRGCEVFGNANLGLHPGSGSQRPVILDNHLHHNDQGLFYCWGVKHGLVEGNVIEDNLRYGVSIGHRDTDNTNRENVIRRNGHVGILYRPEEPAARLPHRNVWERNEIVDNGAEADGYGVWLRDQVEGTVFRDNRLADSGEARQRVGIRIEAEVGDVELTGNRFTGHRHDIDDARA